MKTKHVLAAAVVLSLFVIRHLSFAQGALTPPGAPGPTMTTLTQIEPRTAIASTPFTITNPGAYYLTTNLTVSGGDAIDINTSGVTLDLNGFIISSTAAPNSGTGIFLAGGNRDIAIYNGHIKSGITNNGANVYSGPGFFSGINYSGSVPQNVRVSGLTVSGVDVYGINLGTRNSTLVENCEVRTAGSTGIEGSAIKSCSAADTGGTAIFGDQVADCRGQSAANGDGIIALFVVQNSYGFGTNGNDGINCQGTVQNCYGYSYDGNGIYANNVLNCYGYSSNFGYGIDAQDDAENCYGYNNGSGSGLSSTLAHNCEGSSSSGGGISVYTALSCYAFNGLGSLADAIDATTCENCYGYTYGSGAGISSTVALNCYGYSYYGTGLVATNATNCHATTTSGTAFNVMHNLNSF